VTSLISLLISSEAISDQDYLTDMLRTYRYHLHPIDFARILILRYIELFHHHLKYTSTSTTQPYSNREEWESFTQIRILNVFKKWTSDYINDFFECPELPLLVTQFMEHYVVPNKKQAPFAKSIIDKIQSAGNSRSSSVSGSELNLHRRTASGTKASSPKNTNPFTFLSISALKKKGTMRVGKLSSEASLYSNHGGSTNLMRNSSTNVMRNSFDLLARRKSAASLHSETSQYIPTTESLMAHFDPSVVAEQLTLLEQVQFAAIPVHEFYSQKWNSKYKDIFSPHLVSFIRWFNHIAR
jgi:hypothetical protein